MFCLHFYFRTVNKNSEVKFKYVQEREPRGYANFIVIHEDVGTFTYRSSVIVKGHLEYLPSGARDLTRFPRLISLM